MSTMLLCVWKCLPEVVAAYNALPAGADRRIAKVCSEFHSLVHCTVTITKVCRLRIAQVEAKAFSGADQMFKREEGPGMLDGGLTTQ